MKKISKRIGAMLLIFTMFFQTFGMHVSAAPDTLSGNSITESVVREENTEMENAIDMEAVASDNQDVIEQAIEAEVANRYDFDEQRIVGIMLATYPNV